RLAVVVVEPARVGGHDLEPVLALLQALHDRLGQQVLPLLPVARLERPGLLLGGGGERAGGENGRAETHAELHSVSPRIGGASRQPRSARTAVTRRSPSASSTRATAAGGTGRSGGASAAVGGAARRGASSTTQR